MSLEADVRAVLKAWVEGLTWTDTPTVSAEPPVPGTDHVFPSIAMWFNRIQVELDQPHVVAGDGDGGSGRAVYECGSKNASLACELRCLSYAQAEQFASELQRHQVLRAIASGSQDSLAQHIPATLFGVDRDVVVTWTGEIDLADPGRTGTENLWALTFTGLVDYPWLEQEEAPGTGLLGVTVNVNNEGDYDLDDYEGD